LQNIENDLIAHDNENHMLMLCMNLPTDEI